jgi:hypothetical protein
LRYLRYWLFQTCLTLVVSINKKFECSGDCLHLLLKAQRSSIADCLFCCIIIAPEVRCRKFTNKMTSVKIMLSLLRNQLEFTFVIVRVERAYGQDFVFC